MSGSQKTVKASSPTLHSRTTWVQWNRATEQIGKLKKLHWHQSDERLLRSLKISSTLGMVFPIVLSGVAPLEWIGINKSTCCWFFATYFQLILYVSESESEVTQSCRTLCDPMDCSLPDSSVHGIFQARYWSALPFPSPEDCRPRDWTRVSRTVDRRFTVWATI